MTSLVSLVGVILYVVKCGVLNSIVTLMTIILM